MNTNSCFNWTGWNCYPSPVLHAIKSADTVDGQITIPTSRTLSKEKEQTVYQEINVYRKVQETAEKILELKRQKRGINKKIVRAEKELESVLTGCRPTVWRSKWDFYAAEKRRMGAVSG